MAGTMGRTTDMESTHSSKAAPSRRPRRSPDGHLTSQRQAAEAIAQLTRGGAPWAVWPHLLPPPVSTFLSSRTCFPCVVDRASPSGEFGTAATAPPENHHYTARRKKRRNLDLLPLSLSSLFFQLFFIFLFKTRILSTSSGKIQSWRRVLRNMARCSVNGPSVLFGIVCLNKTRALERCRREKKRALNTRVEIFANGGCSATLPPGRVFFPSTETTERHSQF